MGGVGQLQQTRHDEPKLGSDSSFAELSNLTNGTTVDLSGVKFVDADNGIAVGASGTILKTTDGGKLWRNQYSGTTLLLSGISMNITTSSIAVGDSGMIVLSRRMIALCDAASASR